MIYFTANGRCARCLTGEKITTGSVGIEVRFDLSADFDGLAAIAVFEANGETADVILTGSSCTVPAELLQTAFAPLRIGVYARDGAGTVAIPTVWAEAGVIRPGATPGDVDPTEPIPDWTAQVQKNATDALAKALWAEENVGDALRRADEALDGAESLVGNLVLVQEEEPTDEDNKIWIEENGGEEHLVPTYEEFVGSIDACVKPEKYGAYGDGLHDDTQALQAAIDDAAEMGVPVRLDKTYAISDNLSVCGTLIGHGTVRLLDQSTRLQGAFFETTGSTYIYGIIFDCKSTKPYTADDKNNSDKEQRKFNVAVRHRVAGELVVDGCTFRNLYVNYIIVGANTKKIVSVTNNYFDATEKSNRFMAACISVGDFIQANSIVSIQQNRFSGYVGADDTLDNACAILVTHCLIKRIIIAGNTMMHMGRLATYDGQVGYSRLCAIDFYFNAQNIVISDNKILECNWTPIRLHGVRNVKISRNEIGIAKYINEPAIWISDAKNSAGDAPVGVSNVVIEGNTIAPNTNHYAQTVLQLNSIPRHATVESSISDVVIRNNTIKNFSTQQVILCDDSLKSCVIEGNYIRAKKYVNDDDPDNVVIVNPKGVNLFNYPNGGGDYSESVIKILGNDMTVQNGSCIDLSQASGIDAEITGNRLHVDADEDIETGAGVCVLGPTGGAKVVAISNVLSGEVGIRNAAEAIRNISDCTTDYDAIVSAHENYPAQ